MADTVSIIRMIEEFIKGHGAENCYIGITDDFKRRFREHKVTGNDDKFANKECAGRYEEALTEKKASEIEQLFLNKYKSQNIKGGGGGGKGNSKFVYIYKIVPGVTDEDA